MLAAAFGRLCVETDVTVTVKPQQQSAAFGRLCVETILGLNPANDTNQPPSGGCVLKRKRDCCGAYKFTSRLRAAVC